MPATVVIAKPKRVRSRAMDGRVLLADAAPLFGVANGIVVGKLVRASFRVRGDDLLVGISVALANLVAVAVPGEALAAIRHVRVILAVTAVVRHADTLRYRARELSLIAAIVGTVTPILPAEGKVSGRPALRWIGHGAICGRQLLTFLFGQRAAYFAPSASDDDADHEQRPPH